MTLMMTANILMHRICPCHLSPNSHTIVCLKRHFFYPYAKDIFLLQSGARLSHHHLKSIYHQMMRQVSLLSICLT